jgi:hypothetical protein
MHTKQKYLDNINLHQRKYELITLFVIRKLSEKLKLIILYLLSSFVVLLKTSVSCTHSLINVKSFQFYSHRNSFFCDS